jgi:hypothetical protein
MSQNLVFCVPYFKLLFLMHSLVVNLKKKLVKVQYL